MAHSLPIATRLGQSIAIFATLWSLGGCTAAHRGQIRHESAIRNPPPGQIELVGGVEWPAFPAKWCGTWAGSCRVIKDNEIAMTFHMELAIMPVARANGTMPPDATSEQAAPQKGDRYTWTITYAKDANDTKADSPTRQVRPYTLIVNDAEKGAFTVDEGGGLLLPMHDMAGPLYCTFEVGGRTLRTGIARPEPDNQC